MALGPIDLRLGSPTDQPPEVVAHAMAAATDTLAGYGRSVGSVAFREAAAAWMSRRLEVDVAPEALAACVGTKEFVGSLALLLAPLVEPGRDTVLVPAVAYPTYAVGARLAGCRVVRVPMTPQFTLDLAAIDPSDAARARLLWANTPGNPAGGLDDLIAVGEWGRRHGVVVCSDECYVEFTWLGEPAGEAALPGATILAGGSSGVLALHSLSKRSNLAGARAGAYAGDPALVAALGEHRRELGLVVPGPIQAAAVAAWGDQTHVVRQRARYWRRLQRLAEAAAQAGFPEPAMPDGGFYLWLDVGGPEDEVVTALERVGVLVQPGSIYGPAGAGRIRLAVVRPDAEIDEAARRLGRLPPDWLGSARREGADAAS